jgi:hypothetical protein
LTLNLCGIAGSVGDRLPSFHDGEDVSAPVGAQAAGIHSAENCAEIQKVYDWSRATSPQNIRSDQKARFEKLAVSKAKPGKSTKMRLSS